MQAILSFPVEAKSPPQKRSEIIAKNIRFAFEFSKKNIFIYKWTKYDLDFLNFLNFLDFLNFLKSEFSGFLGAAGDFFDLNFLNFIKFNLEFFEFYEIV